MQYTVLERELLNNYYALGINNSECMLLIHLIDFEQHGETFPSFDQLGARMGLSETEITDMLKQLMAKGWVEIVQDRQGDRYGNHFDLSPVDERLETSEPSGTTSTSTQEKPASTEEDEQEVFEMISNEFGRSLSPVEYQEIARWMTEDGYEPSTIKEAVKEAVMHQAYNLRYISQILYNWKQRNQKKATRQRKRPEQQEGARPHFPVKRVINTDNKD